MVTLLFLAAPCPQPPRGGGALTTKREHSAFPSNQKRVEGTSGDPYDPGVTRAARVGAFHDLVQHIASPVLADLIGYNPNVIAKRATTLGAPWDTYASLRNTTTHR